MRRIIATLILSVLPVAPAHGQTIVDTFRQLRSTVKQLGTKSTAPSSTAGTPATPTGAAQADGGSDDRMVPANVVVDDMSESSLEATPLIARRIMSFDVRGLKLGMSPREVGRIADRQHFRRRWNSLFLTSGTFEVEAARLANQQLNRPIEKNSKIQLKIVEGFDPAGDELKLQFTTEPGGPKLSRIEYDAKLNGTTKAQTFEALARKYGSPSGNDHSMVVSWEGGSGAAENSSPSLRAVVDDGQMMMTLEQSVDYIQGARKRLNDRAQQLAAASGSGVRF